MRKRTWASYVNFQRFTFVAGVEKLFFSETNSLLVVSKEFAVVRWIYLEENKYRIWRKMWINSLIDARIDLYLNKNGKN